MFIPVILIIMIAHLELRTTLLDPLGRLAAVYPHEASNISNTIAFGNYP
jgi:hypothetical protein